MIESDLIVIGTGAGTKLIQPVAKKGFQVTVFEKSSPGGTCLNRGCIPSKMLIYPSEVARIHETGERVGIHFSEKSKFDFSNIVSRIQNTVRADSDSIPVLYEKNPNIRFVPHEAKFVSPYSLSANGELYTAPKIVLAIGARPHIPNIPGLAGTPYWTSTDALENKRLPKSLVVIGGGYIGLELGLAYNGYGTNVSVITRTTILNGIDLELKSEFRKTAKEHIQLFEHSLPQNIRHENGMFHVSFLQNGNLQEITAEKLLLSPGVVPNTDLLDLQNTNIQLDEKGFIPTNEFLETTQAGVYALGDVRGKYFFRHSANFEGEYLFSWLFGGGEKKPISLEGVPFAVFTHPNIAGVGKTEEDCIREKIPYLKGVNPYSSSAAGMARMSSSGFMKVLVHKETKKILGAHCIGDEAPNLIHFFILAIHLDATLDQLLSMIYIHPSLPEISRNALRKVREQL